MSELISNDQQRKELLKHMILQLHKGVAPEAVKKQLMELLGQVPYDTVVEVEQELISEGLPIEQLIKLCDVHSAVLKGQIDQSGSQPAPDGHPVHTFIQENRALQLEAAATLKLIDQALKTGAATFPSSLSEAMASRLNNLLEVDKHYRRKEYLLFPLLEKHAVTGPPTVMWGKHDETRALLKAAREAMDQTRDADEEAWRSLAELVIKPAVDAVEEMIYKEEQILFPMCMDTLSEAEWWEVQRGTPEIGYCLYAPQTIWRPADASSQREAAIPADAGRISLPTGSFSIAELTAFLNTLPFDTTFVDKDDTVRFYSEGKQRVFERNLAVIGRKVQLCHPPGSVYIVQKILDDFRAGRQSRAPFWINMGGRFIHIEYFALRDEKGEYRGTLEVTQDLTQKRQLTGEQRLLSYGSEV